MFLVVGLLVATALLSGHLAAYMAIRSTGSRSSVLMTILMGATAWWAAGNALEDVVSVLPAKLFL